MFQRRTVCMKEGWQTPTSLEILYFYPQRLRVFSHQARLFHSTLCSRSTLCSTVGGDKHQVGWQCTRRRPSGQLYNFYSYHVEPRFGSNVRVGRTSLSGSSQELCPRPFIISREKHTWLHTHTNKLDFGGSVPRSGPRLLM